MDNKELMKCLVDTIEDGSQYSYGYKQGCIDQLLSHKLTAYIEAYGKEQFAQGLDEFLDATKERI